MGPVATMDITTHLKVTEPASPLEAAAVPTEDRIIDMHMQAAAAGADVVVADAAVVDPTSVMAGPWAAST